MNDKFSTQDKANIAREDGQAKLKALDEQVTKAKRKETAAILKTGPVRLYRAGEAE